MAGKTGLLGEFEEMVLLAVYRVADDVYAVPVRAELEERLDRRVSMGAVYGTLDRLEDKGLLTSRLGGDAPGRLGRPRRYFSPLPAAREALEQTARLRTRMWEDVDLGGVSG